MAYTFAPMVAVNPDVIGSVIINGSGKVYAPEDVGFTTPLTVTRLDGSTTNTITTNARGLTQAFTLEGYPSVIFKDDGPGGTAPIDSARGVIEEVLARTAEAESHAAAAAQSAADAAAVNDSGVADRVTNGPLTRAALTTFNQPLQDELDATQLQQDNMAEASATREELIIAFELLAPGTVHGFVAPFPLRIQEAIMTSTNGSAIAASDTNYWKIDLIRTRGGAGVGFATKTSQATGGEPIPANGPWDFAGVTWNETWREFATGDVLRVPLAKVGSPANLGAHTSLTIRYKPL